jgi:hypothetical protein
MHREYRRLLISAGHNSTTSSLGNALLYLARHPDDQQRLRANPTTIPMAIEELLRYDTPVQAMPRRAGGTAQTDSIICTRWRSSTDTIPSRWCDRDAGETDSIIRAFQRLQRRHLGAKHWPALRIIGAIARDTCYK